jgi:hypothetical protein
LKKKALFSGARLPKNKAEVPTVMSGWHQGDAILELRPFFRLPRFYALDPKWRP